MMECSNSNKSHQAGSHAVNCKKIAMKWKREDFQQDTEHKQFAVCIIRVYKTLE